MTAVKATEASYATSLSKMLMKEEIRGQDPGANHQDGLGITRCGGKKKDTEALQRSF